MSNVNVRLTQTPRGRLVIERILVPVFHFPIRILCVALNCVWRRNFGAVDTLGIGQIVAVILGIFHGPHHTYQNPHLIFRE
jgi:hypothetical protein